MDIQSIIQSLAGHHGQNVKAAWRRTCKTHKGCPHVIEKETQAIVRGGINYANKREVRDGIESGERGEVQSLPWGQWAQFPVHITHNGQDYVALDSASGFAANVAPTVRFFMDGEEVPRETVAPFLLASELSSRESLSRFTIKAESVLFIVKE